MAIRAVLIAQHSLAIRNFVNAIETGKYDSSLPLAFAIARLFEKPIEEIFDDEIDVQVAAQ